MTDTGRTLTNVGILSVVLAFLVGIVSLNPGILLIGFFVGLVFISAGMHISRGHQSACPSCHKSFAVTLVGQRPIGQSYGYATEPGVFFGQEFNSATGQTEFSTVFGPDHQYRVMKVLWLNTFKCRFCNHTWTTQSLTEHKSFEEPTTQQNVIVTREVVKIPCKYCGTLMPITESNCSKCGAPLR